MDRSPRQRRRPPGPIDWATLCVTAWIVVTAAMLTGSLLAAHYGR